MTKSKRKNTRKWLMYGIIAALLAAPNGLLSKYSINTLDPFTFSLIRFLGIAVISAPFVLLATKKIHLKNIKYAILGGLFLTIASLGFAWALYYGQANLVIILMLASPVLLVFFSAKITHERIKKKAIAGIALAALGAFVIIFAPLISSGVETSGTFWLAALFVLADIIAFPLAIVYFKKANKKGLPITTTLGVSSWVSTIVYLLLFLMFVDGGIPDMPTSVLISTIYTGVVVVFVARLLDLMTYKKLGSAVLSTLFYLEMFLGIWLATVLLNEPLTISMFVGGVIILLSIWITESHKHPHFHHIHILKRH